MGYEKSPRVRAIAEALIDDHHPHLKDAKDHIEFYVRDDNGVDWSGKCKKCTSFERFLTGKMFHIFIVKPAFQNWPMEKLKALVDHELCHIQRAVGMMITDPNTGRILKKEWADKDDPESWHIREHDVEEFSDMENIGLMWYNPQTGAVTTKKKAVWRNIEIDALMLLYVIMNRLDSDCLPFHSTQVDYWRDWLAGKINDRELGYQVRSKLVTRINELEQENKRYSNFKEDREEHGQIVNVMRKHGLSTWGNVAETLDAALSRPYPAELNTIRSQLANSILSIDKLKEKAEVL